VPLGDHITNSFAESISVIVTAAFSYLFC